MDKKTENLHIRRINVGGTQLPTRDRVAKSVSATAKRWLSEDGEKFPEYK